MSSDEKALNVEARLDLALENARTCVEIGHGAGDWPGAYLRDVTELRAARDRARSVAVALEQELALTDQALDEIREMIDDPFSFGPVNVDIARILSDLAASLDAQLNKEDDDQ